MNEKEIAELRRRFRADKSNIARVCGCCVNEKREIISRFDQSLALMGQEDAGRVLGLLRKSLSGTLERNLLDIPFETSQVAGGEEHGLLMALRNSQLRDEQALETFFQRAAQSLELEGNYLILLAFDAYDVPYRSRDGLRQEDASEEVFSYIVCSVCPVKLTRETLGFSADESRLCTLAADWAVAAPETGFLFPSFDGRSTNLYNALLYTKDTASSQEGFVKAVLGTPAPMPAQEQMETFHTILADTLSDACSYEVVHAVHDQLRGLMEEHKAAREEEPLTVTGQAVGQVLSACGVEARQVEAFERQCDEAYGAGADLSPRNLVDPKQLELRTPDVTIRVSPDRGDLVETRVINGVRYILIRAEEGVEVNGVQVHIRSEQ